MRIVGIMGAMPEEVNHLIALLSSVHTTELGGRTYYAGTLNGVQTIVVFSRWGKVAAASTATTLILTFGVTEILFTGVAGAIHPTLRIGDIVIGKHLFQHDMDARPLMKRFEIPLLGVTHFTCDPHLMNRAEQIVQSILKDQPAQYRVGDIASGDQFVAAAQQKTHLLSDWPTTLCVEMEGAAVAQVCFEHRIPVLVIRVISDAADEQAAIDFPLFVEKVASQYTTAFVQAYLYICNRLMPSSWCVA